MRPGPRDASSIISRASRVESPQVRHASIRCRAASSTVLMRCFNNPSGPANDSPCSLLRAQARAPLPVRPDRQPTPSSWSWCPVLRSSPILRAHHETGASAGHTIRSKSDEPGSVDCEASTCSSATAEPSGELGSPVGESSGRLTAGSQSHPRWFRGLTLWVGVGAYEYPEQAVGISVGDEHSTDVG